MSQQLQDRVVQQEERVSALDMRHCCSGVRLEVVAARNTLNALRTELARKGSVDLLRRVDMALVDLLCIEHNERGHRA